MGFGNPFDVTKLDNTSKFPQVMLDNDYFIVHLGKGKHKFVKGINKGFHRFEPIAPENIYTWKYRKSILNEFDTSESNILSVGFNLGDEKIQASGLQMEIDLTTEYNGVVTVFEGKNNFPENFAVYQLYFPFLYYHKLKTENKLAINDINCCYLLRKKEGEQSVIRIYQYTFENPDDMASIRLIKNAQYNLIKR